MPQGYKYVTAQLHQASSEGRTSAEPEARYGPTAVPPTNLMQDFRDQKLSGCDSYNYPHANELTHPHFRKPLYGFERLSLERCISEKVDFVLF